MVLDTSLSIAFEYQGIPPAEAKVYLALAELGRASAHAVARKADLERSTTYGLLSRLVKRGLVSQQMERKVALFVANPPTSLLESIAEAKSKLHTREEQAKQLVQKISPYFKKRDYRVPRMSFFDGEREVNKLLFENLNLWFASAKQADNTLWGYSDESFVKKFQPWLEEYWKRMDKDHHIKLYCNYSEEEEKLRGSFPNREIRTVPKKYELEAGFWAIGDYIMLFLTREKPYYAYQIYDPVIATNIRRMFQMMWEKQG